MLDLELYHPYRWLIVAVFGAVLLLSLTVRRQVLGWQLLVLGERVDSVVVSIDRSGYRVRTANGVIVHSDAPGMARSLRSIERWAAGRPPSRVRHARHRHAVSATVGAELRKPSRSSVGPRSPRREFCGALMTTWPVRVRSMATLPGIFFPEVAPPMQAFLELVIAALGCVFALWILRRRLARTVAAAELKAQREEMWLRRLAQQKRARERLLAINDESLSLLESMPGCVESAESHLDQAEIDFTEGAFAPFWNSVERAVVSLAGFDESVQKLESNSCEYIDLLARCKGPVPSFAVSAVSPTRMRLATATSHRLHGVVRRAQRDFQF